MKTKILIISLLLCLNSFGQKLPITNLCLSDIVAVTGGTCLSDAFTNANSSYFDATYATSGNCLSEFKNYGPATATTPTVTTAAITVITGTTATGGGNVTSDGGASVTARGVCWNTSTNPTTANSKTSNGTGTGSFSSSLTSLTAGTLYYVRAYATNSAGTAYGSNVSFTTSPTPPAGYGNLYNYWALTNLAASGWHVPTDTEWHTLALYLDASATLTGTQESATAGATLKETGTTHWTTPNTGATNGVSFTGLPEGARYYTGEYYNRGFTTTWASSTYNPDVDGFWYRSLGYNNTAIYRDVARLNYGFSVRLLKDNSTDTGTYTGNDGTTYSTVKIGNQVWTSVNITETKYNTGAAIPFISDATAWAALTTGAMCTYVP